MSTTLVRACSRSSTPCPERDDSTVETPRCCIDACVEILAAVAPLLDAAGVRWWADYGMLLGHAVNGGWYWNDRDIDIGVLVEDRAKVVSICSQLAREHHWLMTNRAADLSRPWRYSDCVKLTNSVKNRATLDITLWHTRPDGVLDRLAWAEVDRHKGREMPADWVFPTARVEWEGVSVPIPREAEQLLAYRYGEDWRELGPGRTDGVTRGIEYFGRVRADCEVTDWEGMVLRKHAVLVPAEHAIVEIGAYQGRSMCWLAEGSNMGHRAPVYSVDLWEEGPGYAKTRHGRKVPRPYAETATRATYEALREAYGHGLVTPIRGHSVEVAATFKQPVGLLFVDGDHTEQGVRADLAAWLPKVPVGGMVAFHDMNAPGVLSAIRRTVGRRRGGWRQVERVRLVGVYERVA